MKITLNNINRVYRSPKVSEDTMKVKGYKLIKNLFVDSSGWGRENEPALTANQFERELKELISANNGVVYTTITDAGMFQVYVGVFIKDQSLKTSRVLERNTLLVNYPDGSRAIRYHDTDIITERDGYLTFNNGGWATRSTHDRMRRYSRKFVYRKNFETYIDGVWLPYNTDSQKIKGSLYI